MVFHKEELSNSWNIHTMDYLTFCSESSPLLGGIQTAGECLLYLKHKYRGDSSIGSKTGLGDCEGIFYCKSQ